MSKDKDKKIPKYLAKSYELYTKDLELDKLSTKLKLKWQKDLIKAFDVNKSGAWRYNAYYQMFYYLFPKKIEYNTTNFNLTRLRKSVQYNANYTFLYTVFQNGKIIPEYICLDGTYVSADGEFRHRFIPYKQFI